MPNSPCTPPPGTAPGAVCVLEHAASGIEMLAPWNGIAWTCDLGSMVMPFEPIGFRFVRIAADA